MADEAEGLSCSTPSLLRRPPGRPRNALPATKEDAIDMNDMLLLDTTVAAERAPYARCGGASIVFARARARAAGGAG